jgi:hypothetical protein
MGSIRFGLVLIAAGVVLVLLASLADPIGIGGAHGWGWKQTVGVVVGAAIILLGVGLAALARRPASYGEGPAEGT